MSRYSSPPCFLLAEYQPRKLSVLLNLRPCELVNVGFAQTCQTREQKSTLQHRIPALCSVQSLHFFQSEIHTLRIGHAKALHSVSRIFRNEPPVGCYFQAGFQNAEVRAFRSERESVPLIVPTALMIEVRCSVEILFESLHRCNCCFKDTKT